MTEYRPRFFTSDAEIERIGEGLLARNLPRNDWTHEAHLAATTYLVLRRPEIELDKELPDIIRRYNESVGGVNDDTQGYHETITRTFLHGVRLFWPTQTPTRRCTSSLTSCSCRGWDGATGRYVSTRANDCSRWKLGGSSRRPI